MDIWGNFRDYTDQAVLWEQFKFSLVQYPELEILFVPPCGSLVQKPLQPPECNRTHIKFVASYFRSAMSQCSTVAHDRVLRLTVLNHMQTFHHYNFLCRTSGILCFIFWIHYSCFILRPDMTFYEVRCTNNKTSKDVGLMWSYKQPHQHFIYLYHLNNINENSQCLLLVVDLWWCVLHN